MDETVVSIVTPQVLRVEEEVAEEAAAAEEGAPEAEGEAPQEAQAGGEDSES